MNHFYLSFLLICSIVCLGQHSHAQNPSQDLSRLENVSTLGLGALYGIAHTPDGRNLISYGGRGIIIRDGVTGEVQRIIETDAQIIRLAVSPDGLSIAAVRLKDHVINIYELHTGRLLQNLQGHTGFISAVVYSPDGRYLASGSTDDDIKIWEVVSGQEIASLNATVNIATLAYSPDGRYLASGLESRESNLKIWEVASGQEVQNLSGHENSVASIAYSSDGRYLASGSADENIKIWEVASGKEVQSFVDDKGYIFSIAYSPDERYLASLTKSGHVKIWEIATGKAIAGSSQHTGEARSLSYHPDGREFVSAAFDNTIKFWNASSGRELKTLSDHLDVVYTVACSPHCQYLAARTYNGTIKLWEVHSGREIQNFKAGKGRFEALKYSPDGRYLAANSQNDIKIWEVNSGSEVQSLTGHSGNVNSIAYSPDGHYLTFASDDSIKIWEVNSGSEMQSLTGHSGNVHSIAYSPDGRYLASTSADDGIRIWEVNSGSEVQSLTGHSGNVRSIAYSPDGRYLASASADSIKIWEARSGQEVRSLKHIILSHSLVYSPDGRYLSFIIEQNDSPTSQLNILEISTGEVTALGNRDVASATFSPDGIYLFTASGVEGVRVWATPERRAVFCYSCNQHENYQLSITTPFPHSSWRNPQLQLAVNIEPSTAPLPSLEVRVNGQLVPSNQVAIRNIGVASTQKQLVLTLPSDLPSNRDFTVSVAIAGTDTSETLPLHYSYRPVRKPDLYLLAVGVNRYADSGITDLRYAAQDAEAIANLFVEQQGGLYNRVYSTVLLDEEATKFAVSSELGLMVRRAQEDDVIIVFMAAHGVNGQDSDQPGYYIVLHDSSTQNYFSSALPEHAIHYIANESKAHVFFFLDTCHSGLPGRLTAADSSLTPLVDRLVEDNADLDRFVGVFAASQANQFAQEDASWGHGAFTKALLEGFQQEQYSLTPQGAVNPFSLMNWVSHRVKILTNDKQRPSFNGSGGDYNLYLRQP